MDIAQIASTNPTQATNPFHTANTDRSERPNTEQKPSTVVNISDEARRVNEAKNAEHTATPSNAPENKEPQSKEAAEAPGIQFMEGESKGGRVSTYA